MSKLSHNDRFLKVLGGTSVLNAMLYVRGNKRDYDSWAALGNTGWDYESVLPYFKQSEDVRVEDLHDSPYHQRGGYLTVEYFKYTPPVVDYIVRSGEELGYKVQDINGENQTGFAYSYGTIRDGLRCSTAKAFIRPASKRKNLHVSMESLVEKILVRNGLENYIIVSALCFTEIMILWFTRTTWIFNTFTANLISWKFSHPWCENDFFRPNYSLCNIVIINDIILFNNAERENFAFSRKLFYHLIINKIQYISHGRYVRDQRVIYIHLISYSNGFSFIYRWHIENSIWGAVSQRRETFRSPCETRNYSIRGCDTIAAVADVVGHRAARSSRENEDPRRASRTRRRAESSRSRGGGADVLG